MQKYPEKIILYPLLTEKSNISKEKDKYIFKVLLQSNKKEIMNAIEALFKVRPLSCNVMNVRGKKKRQGKAVGRTSRYKKAIVSLKKGDSISIFEGA